MGRDDSKFELTFKFREANMRQIFIAVVSVGICLIATGVAFEVQASHGKAKVGIKIIKIGVLKNDINGVI